VLAVLPHTALQTVVSLSGLARQIMTGQKGEPMFSEKGIRPAVVVSRAMASCKALGLVAQQRAPAPADATVEGRELRAMGVRKLREPTTQQRVEAGDHVLQALAATAARELPDPLLQHPPTARAHVAPTRLKAVAQELE